SDPDRPEHRAESRLCDGALEATLADRGEHLQHYADRRLQGKIHRKAAAGKIVEHARQILLQTATRPFADAWIGSRHAGDERAPRRILERPFNEGVAAQSDTQQGIGGRDASQLYHFIERMDQLVSNGDGEGVHVLEMHIERPFRDSRLAHEIINGDRRPRALGEQGRGCCNELRPGPRPLLLTDLRPPFEIDLRHESPCPMRPACCMVAWFVRRRSAPSSRASTNPQSKTFPASSKWCAEGTSLASSR